MLSGVTISVLSHVTAWLVLLFVIRSKCVLDEHAGLSVLQTLISDAQHASKPEYLAHRVTSNAASTNSRHPHRWTITTEHISAFKGEQTTTWPCQHDMLDHAYGQCKCCAKLCTPMSIRDVQLAHAVLAGGIFECLVANVHAFANGWPSLQPHHAVLSQYPAHKLQPLETVWATQKGQCSRPWSHSS